MGYDYECPDCGKEYGENSSLGSIPKSNRCDDCADKRWEKKIRKDEQEKVLKRFNDELEELDCYGEMCCRDYLKTVVTALRQEGGVEK